MSRTPTPEEAKRAAAAAGDAPEIIPGPPGTSNGQQAARRIVLTPASAIEAEPVEWVWTDDELGRIPGGSLGLAAGREGTGKSSFSIWLAAKITTGTLPGIFWGQPRGVIIVAVEDSWRFTIKPRLTAAGADCGLVYRAEVKTVAGDTVSLSLPADLVLLEQAIGENDIGLVVVDPLLSAVSDVLDTHVNREVRQALDPLARMADRSGAVVLGIAHFNKSGGTDASSLITGSGAFKDVARYIFAFAADDGGAHVITQEKNNLGRSDLPSLAYRIVSAIVPTVKGDADVGRFVLDGTSERTVSDVLGVAPGERDVKGRAERFLRDALTGGPRLSKDVEDEAREVEDVSRRTLMRARADLRIPAAKRSDGRWWISLPEHEGDLAAPLPAKDAKDAKDASPGTVGTLGTLGGVDP